MGAGLQSADGDRPEGARGGWPQGQGSPRGVGALWVPSWARVAQHVNSARGRRGDFVNGKAPGSGSIETPGSPRTRGVGRGGGGGGGSGGTVPGAGNSLAGEAEREEIPVPRGTSGYRSWNLQRGWERPWAHPSPQEPCLSPRGEGFTGGLITQKSCGEEGVSRGSLERPRAPQRRTVRWCEAAGASRSQGPSERRAGGAPRRVSGSQGDSGVNPRLVLKPPGRPQGLAQPGAEEAGPKAVRHTRSKLSVPVVSEVARLAGGRGPEGPGLVPPGGLSLAAPQGDAASPGAEPLRVCIPPVPALLGALTGYSRGRGRGARRGGTLGPHPVPRAAPGSEVT